MIRLFGKRGNSIEDTPNPTETEHPKSATSTIEGTNAASLNNFNFNFNDIKIPLEREPSLKGETINFKEGTEKEDKNGHYIEINGEKYYKRHKGINGFTYKRNETYEYKKDYPLIIGFCKNGEFSTQIQITEKGEPAKSKLINEELSENLKFNFYIPYNETGLPEDDIKNIKPSNFYKPLNEDTGNIDNKSLIFSRDYLEENEKFKEYKEGESKSGLFYIKFEKENEHGANVPGVLLANFEQGKIKGPCRCLRFNGTMGEYEDLIAIPEPPKNN